LNVISARISGTLIGGSFPNGVESDERETSTVVDQIESEVTGGCSETDLAIHTARSFSKRIRLADFGPNFGSPNVHVKSGNTVILVVTEIEPRDERRVETVPVNRGGPREADLAGNVGVIANYSSEDVIIPTDGLAAGGWRRTSGGRRDILAEGGVGNIDQIRSVGVGCGVGIPNTDPRVVKNIIERVLGVNFHGIGVTTELGDVHEDLFERALTTPVGITHVNSRRVIRRHGASR